MLAGAEMSILTSISSKKKIGPETKKWEHNEVLKISWAYMG